MFTFIGRATMLIVFLRYPATHRDVQPPAYAHFGETGTLRSISTEHQITLHHPIGILCLGYSHHATHQLEAYPSGV